MIEFHALGSLSLVRRDGQDATPLLVRPKQTALLAYLALHQPRGWKQRNSLLAVFWPESDDKRARFSLRSALHGLRSELGADAVLARGDDELMLNADLVRCDVIEFEDAIETGRLEDAMSLYRGPLLDGLIVPGVADFQLWIDQRREGLRRQATSAAAELAHRAAATNDVDGSMKWLRRAIELAPHDETLLRKLIQALVERGDRAEALAVYEQWAARLRADLDSEPSPETVAVADHLRARSPAPERTRSMASAEPLSGDSKNQSSKPASMAAPPSKTPILARRSRQIATGIGIGLGIVALWFAGSIGFRKSSVAEIGLNPSSAGATAVLPFSFSGDAKYARLADAAATLVSSGLGDAGPLRAMDPHVVAATAKSTGGDAAGAGASTARRLGATNYVVGSIAVEQNLVRLQAALYAVGDETKPIGRASASGSADSLLVIAERVAFDLLASRIGGVSVDMLGTTSEPALRAYFDGERELFAARYAGAADAYARAVSTDSNFARAYFRLSYAASLGGHDSLSRASGERASQLRARLTPNDRILLDAWLNALHPNIPLSITLYEKALTQDERNPEAWLQLGEIRFHWGPSLGIPASSAAEAFQHVTAMVPNSGAALIHLARIEARDAPHGGRLDTLAAAAQRLHLAATEDLELRMLSAIVSGRARLRDSVLAEAAARGSGTERQLVMTAVQFADTTMSMSLAREMTRADARVDMRVFGYAILAQIAASHGRIRDALQFLHSMSVIAPQRALELHALLLALPFVSADRATLLTVRDSLDHMPPGAKPIGSSTSEIAKPTIFAPRRLYLEGVLSILAGDTTRAIALSDTLAKWPFDFTHEVANAADYAQSLRAELVMRQSPALGAAAFAAPHTPADKTYPDLMTFFVARDRFLRAEALRLAGRTNEALSWYETFPDPSGYDVWFLAPALERRAELYAARGRRDDARRAYERFIALWDGADESLAPRVEHARAAMSR